MSDVQLKKPQIWEFIGGIRIYRFFIQEFEVQGKRCKKHLERIKDFLKWNKIGLKLYLERILYKQKESFGTICVHIPFGIPFKLARGEIGRRFSLSPVWKDKYKGELTNTVEESLVTLMKEHFLDDDELEDSSEQRRIQELMDVFVWT